MGPHHEREGAAFAHQLDDFRRWRAANLRLLFARRRGSKRLNLTDMPRVSPVPNTLQLGDEKGYRLFYPPHLSEVLDALKRIGTGRVIITES